MFAASTIAVCTLCILCIKIEAKVLDQEDVMLNNVNRLWQVNPFVSSQESDDALYTTTSTTMSSLETPDSSTSTEVTVEEYQSVIMPSLSNDFATTESVPKYEVDDFPLDDSAEFYPLTTQSPEKIWRTIEKDDTNTNINNDEGLGTFETHRQLLIIVTKTTTLTLFTMITCFVIVCFLVCCASLCLSMGRHAVEIRPNNKLSTVSSKFNYIHSNAAPGPICKV